MLKSASRIKALTLHASDGEIGSVEDFYFDDQTWTIRYFILNTGGWLSGRLVLVSPTFVSGIDWDAMAINVTLTKHQIEASPDIDIHMPVSRQREEEYMDHFRAEHYWKAPMEKRIAGDDPGPGDTHLRSTNAMTGYHLHAADGEMGSVKDFIISVNDWSVRYLDVNWNWLPGKTVLIAPEWIDRVGLSDSAVWVALDTATIRAAPEFIESRELTRAYEQELHEYYGRPPYWLHESRRAARA